MFALILNLLSAILFIKEFMNKFNEARTKIDMITSPQTNLDFNFKANIFSPEEIISLELIENDEMIEGDFTEKENYFMCCNMWG